NLYLTIDAEVCKAANNALDGRKGTVGVYNYKTGEIVCMVSSPNYDPQDPPTVSADDTSGIYMNKLISSRVVPGSIFKVITATAAIETLTDLDNFSYTCTGSRQFGTAKTDKVTCPYDHGTVNFEDALAVSCNCAFAELSLQLGPSTLEKYTKMAGLTSSYSINGIKTTPGTFDFPSADVTLAWTGIGQHQDLVNPCSMMLYMGAVASGGKAAEPRIIDSVKFSNNFPASFPFKGKTDQLIEAETAKKLGDLLHNDVVKTYGEENFPGLDLCAKSGTAQLDNGKEPHAWFTGYLRNEGYPYAFIVLVENGGWGSETAGAVANTVLQQVIEKDAYVEE
ncbi:MAG: penicillin-binding transpeptidase domain-containing protein, partial [Anaerovoracaceae bacterium]